MKGEQQEVKFDKELHHFLAMAIEIWPTFQSATKHLHEVGKPYSGSYLPDRQYNLMTPENFTKTIADDLFEFIMTHDVTPEYIEDYLADVLDLLMVEEEIVGGNSNPASIHRMAIYTTEVIAELQEGRRDKVTAFEEGIYQNVKQFKGQVIQQKVQESQSQSQQESDSQGSDYSDLEEIEERVQEMAPQKSEQQLQREKQLQDDGWVIVKKKR